MWCILLLLLGQNGPAARVELQEPDLNESSGVCVAASGEVWSHNDSGDTPRLFAFNRQGQRVAECQVKGARAADWEDICSFELDGKHYFAIGDVGDNLARRESVQIYVVEQPHPDQLSENTFDLESLCRIEVSYPQGALNCEALAFDPLTRSFVLVSKQTLHCQFYRVPIQDFLRDRAVRAEEGPRLLVPMVTGADISPDGKRLVLSTYGPGILLERHADASRGWLTDRPQTFELPSRRLGESICFADDAANLLLTSEFAPAPLFTVPCPAPE